MDQAQYKNANDTNFLTAARLGIASLREAVRWLDGLRQRCEQDAEFWATLSLVLDPDYERRIAGSYLVLLHGDIDALESPQESTPERRKEARLRIAMVRSWAISWDRGEPYRDRIYSDPTPSDGDVYPYSPPSLIDTVQLPARLPGELDPYADSM